MSNAHRGDRNGSEPPLNCGEVRELLVPWLDDELPADEAQRVSGHVGQCAACACELEQHRRVGSTLDAVYSARPAGPDMVSEVRRRIERERRTASTRMLRRVVLGVAASLLVGVGVWWMVTSPGAEPSGTSPGGDANLVGEVPADDGLLENLDVLEALGEEDVDLTPELVQALLDDEADELDELFEFVLEEEVLADQL